MLGTIDLYNLALTPNDTMYFDSTETQTEWFNNQEHLSIDDISFNGARAFQLGKNYLDVIFNYNYVRYKLNDRYIYAFIENVDYTNDNCCSLNISIDLNQTFLEQLKDAIATSNIKNHTEKESYFYSYHPYNNKFPVPDYVSVKIGELNKYNDPDNYDMDVMLGFLVLNVDPKIQLNYFDGTHKTRSLPYVEDNRYFMPCSVVIFPMQYNRTTKQFIEVGFATSNGINFKYENSTTDTVPIVGAEYFNQFMSAYGSYVSTVGFTFEPIGGISLNLEQKYLPYITASNNDVLLIESVKDNSGTEIGNILCIKRNNKKYLTEIPLPFNEDIPLLREPYTKIVIGNKYEQIYLNLLDFFMSNTILEPPYVLKIEHFTSVIYPFTTNMNIYLNTAPIKDRLLAFNLTTSDPIPYRLDAWEQYYATNKASVNDGLATQQKYERIQQGISTTSNIITGVMDIGTSIIPYTKAGNLYKSIHKPTDRSVINGAVSGFQTILNAGVEWANSEVERQKQRALLDIQWNDIKSSPSDMSNMQSSITSKYNDGGQNIQVYYIYASNFDDIKNYHKRYGYQLNIQKKLTWNDIKKHTVFDYISFNEISIKSNLPQFYTATLEQQYETGVRFWYDYNNFMNFDIPNEEIAGGSQ